MGETQIIFMVLGTLGCILLIFGYLIKFKNKIHLVAGVNKNNGKVKDIKGFASLVGGNVLLLGLIFCAGAFGIYICPSYKRLIEPALLLSLLVIGILTYTKSKKYIEM